MIVPAGSERDEGGDRRPGRSMIGQGPGEATVFLVLGLLVASTMFLAAHSTLIHRRTRALTQETAVVIAPALRASQGLIVAASLEREALLRVALAGDTAAQADRRGHAAARAAAMAELVQLADRVGGEPLRLARRLQRLEGQWDAMSAAIAGARGAPAAASSADGAALFSGLLLEATALEETLRSTLEDAWVRISVAERLDWYYTIGQVLVALAASIYIARLVRRIRRLAEVSEQRRREAESAMEDRARLIRGITHDVKNPLGVADMSAQLLEMNLRGSLTDAQRIAVARIRRGIGGALAIVHDLLELSRAEAGHLVVAVATTDVAALVRQLADDYRAEAESRRISLRLQLNDRVPPVATDPNRVSQILGNLLSNAFKFTPDGGRITVCAAPEDDGWHHRRWLGVSVADNGPGIGPEDRDRIFEEFYRTEEAAARTAGVGVGLAISRRLARLLGGDLYVVSEPGRSTVFTLRLPLHGEPAEPRV